MVALHAPLQYALALIPFGSTKGFMVMPPTIRRPSVPIALAACCGNEAPVPSREVCCGSNEEATTKAPKDESESVCCAPSKESTSSNEPCCGSDELNVVAAAGLATDSTSRIEATAEADTAQPRGGNDEPEPTNESCCGSVESADTTPADPLPTQTGDEILRLVAKTYADTVNKQKNGIAAVDPTMMGYSEEELVGLEEANLGLGCGNPLNFGNLQEGETVVDLGSGAGIDCFLASKKVGPSGNVIGVDMTPDMIQTARANAKKSKVGNVEFRLGEIEHLPVADNSADIVISNCVINLSPDKQQVFREIHRILAVGGRIAISDVVTRPEKVIPQELKTAEALAC